MSVELGRVGVWTWAFEASPWPEVRAAAQEIEQLGYGALWFGEMDGRDAVSQAALLLGATERMVIAPGVAIIYRHHPATLAQAERALAEAYPGRFALGLGVSNRAYMEERGHTWQPPVRAMREYLDAMDAAPLTGPAGPRAPRLLAALGPKMVELAAERAWGAHPYFMPVEHTAYVRERLGPEAKLVVHQNITLHEDPAEARRLARSSLAPWLAMGDTTSSRWRLISELTGVTEADLAHGGSDRLVDAMIAHGDAEMIAERVRAQFAAGADHVCISVATEFGVPELGLAQLRELAPVLL
ncbi:MULTISPECIES: TIGR03620 family F420-dependent LLM class oxidoreductase [unclassified Crossiella]|uniref:TIGR03620 family F420-dependent LLM class oxidoreductase n=1 Tax=unclassified Crossiella TaxID=2620835 RepID=UPI001FFF7D3D|nr:MULTISPECIES: TIGR03620 family F420-dependent LLM class oxidoreductase [unclassified Crossiella]MCK2240748.1 TIGR03620 family F420-dependent LLM class oxidoreductase [Crossiella sp. S99.2]MCK2254108.1 TIGR03620 family F420-dependent LLM class oxidoreductase [Crossiella sp. S99.1]